MSHESKSNSERDGMEELQSLGAGPERFANRTTADHAVNNYDGCLLGYGRNPENNEWEYVWIAAAEGSWRMIKSSQGKARSAHFFDLEELRRLHEGIGVLIQEWQDELLRQQKHG